MSTEKQSYPRMLYQRGDLSHYAIADSAEHEKVLLAGGWLHHDDALKPAPAEKAPAKGGK